MKSLLKILLVVAIIVPSVVVVIGTSCKKDKCKGVTCLHGGTCHGGSCTCPAGYEGSNCGVEWRAKFLGNWTQKGYGGHSNSPFQLSVVKDTSSVLKVSIINFDNTVGTAVSGNVTSSDTLAIPNQFVDSSLVDYGLVYYVNSSDIHIFYEIFNIKDPTVTKTDTVMTTW